MERHENTVTDVKVLALMEALATPFDLDEVKFKPAVVSGTRALALAYVDARVIQDRLDDVLGVAGWQDEYECLPDGSVVCRLRLRLGTEWITKMDVGGPSEQPDEGDRRKAAFSDALKRAAVKFGVGRYLYRLPQLWADYDPQKRQFKSKPTLPANALPPVRKAPQETPPEKKPAKQEAKRSETVAARSRAVVAEAEPVKETPAPTTEATHKLPSNGLELLKRLSAYEKQLATQGVCKEGELVKHIVAAGVKAGYEPDMTTWTMPAIQFAVGETKAFEAKVRQPSKSKDAA